MRTFRRVLVVVLVLAALLVAVDRIGAWVAGQVVADQVSRELSRYNVESGSPDVSLGGFPFLTQVVSGEYDEITIRSPDVWADDVRLRDVELTATGVTAAMSTLIDRSGPISAGRVDGTAVVGYQSVVALTGIDGLELSSAAGGDEMAVRMPVEALGASVTLAGTATVSVEGNTLQMRVTELGVDDSVELPAGADLELDQFSRAASVEVPLPAMPYDLAVESARPAESGIVVTFSAQDVPLSR